MKKIIFAKQQKVFNEEHLEHQGTSYMVSLEVINLHYLQSLF